MLKGLKSKKEKDKAIIGIVIGVLLIILGYVVLKIISTVEEPPLGHTLFILVGTTLIAVGGLGIIVILKYLYDLFKRNKRKETKRKRHKIVFLKKEALKNSNKKE